MNFHPFLRLVTSKRTHAFNRFISADSYSGLKVRREQFLLRFRNAFPRVLAEAIVLYLTKPTLEFGLIL